MIEWVELVDFQRHKKLRIPLKQVTTLVGPSDAGKSAIIRALRLLALNRPSGTGGYVRHGAKVLKVRACVDGKVITRIKGRGKNAYVLDGQTYKALGSGAVPGAVADVLNVSPASFQGQFDPPLWFDESAGQVAKHLNELVDLQIIDRSTGEANRRARRAEAVADAARAEASAAREEWASLAGARACVRAYAPLATMEAELMAEKSRKEALSLLVRQCSQHAKDFASCEAVADVGRDLVVLGGALVANRKKVGRLRELINQARQYRSALNNPVPEVGALVAFRARADRAAERRRRLEFLIDTVREREAVKCQLDVQVAELTKKLTKFRVSICPKCKQPIPPRSSSASVTFTRPKNRHHCGRGKTG